MEPKSFKEVLKSPHKDYWIESMNSEIASLYENDVWDIVPKPKGQKIVDGKWILSLKKLASGKIDRFKARYVARGFTQVEGKDYNGTYSPVLGISSLRILLSLAAQHSWILEQMDVKTAFLYGELEEEIYLNQPPGFIDPGKEDYVCKLKKSIYALKQAGKVWNTTFDIFLKSLGFDQVTNEKCIYFKRTDDDITIIGVYVDDLVITGNSRKQIDLLKSSLSLKFKMKDLGPLNYCLGLNITQDGGAITVSQSHYIDTLLERFGFDKCNSITTPMEPNLCLKKSTSTDILDQPYRQAIGSLLYLANSTRPDISYAVSTLSQFLNHPDSTHWNAVKHLFKYLRGTTNYKLQYSKVPGFYSFTDADWARDVGTRKSTTGYMTFFGGGPISWRSQKQRCIAKSTMEAEFVALSDSGSDIMGLKQILQTLGFCQGTTKIFEDNNACMQFSINEASDTFAKHIATRYHWIKNEIALGEFELVRCPTNDMLADMLTKPLARPQLQHILMKIGLRGDVKIGAY